MFSALADLSDEIDWSAVDPVLVERWLTTVRSAAASRDVITLDAIRIFKMLNVDIPEDLLERLEGMELAVALIGGYVVDTDGVVFATVEPNIAESMAQIRANAADGRHDGYVWPPATVGAHLVTSLSRDGLWEPLTDLLCDPRVPNSDKVGAFEVLIANSGTATLPGPAAARLSGDLTPTDDGEFDPLFSVSAELYAGVLRTFRISYGLVEPSELVVDAMRDAGSRDASVRRQVARTLAVASAQHPEVAWPQVVLLQLSHDRDPQTRNAASRGLAAVSTSEAPVMIEAIRDRVLSLLQEPGIAMPLGALQALLVGERGDQRWAASDRLWCLEQVLALRNHESRLVGRAAEMVVDKYPQRDGDV